MNVILLLCFVCFSLQQICQGYRGNYLKYELKVSISPDQCRGGEACDIQPVVDVVDLKEERVFNFNGFAYASLHSSPTGFEKAYIGNGCDDSGYCGEEIKGMNFKVNIVGGRATFQNLIFKTAGRGYIIKFSGFNDLMRPFAHVLSERINVEIGSVFKVIFSSSIRAVGGLPFQPIPEIQVVDRGSNLVFTSYGYFTVSLCEFPYPNSNLNNLSTTYHITNGIGEINGIFINRAGYPYALCINATVNSDTEFSLRSTDFAVTIGDCSYLQFASYATSNVFRAGEYFSMHPFVKTYDSGFNFLENNNVGYISVVLYNNPSGASLEVTSGIRPANIRTQNLFSTVIFLPVSKIEFGEALFSSFRIDKIGKRYQLGYFYHQYIESAIENPTASTIFLLSDLFDIVEGPPRQLKVLQSIGGAWADGQVFLQQPILSVTDLGGNVVDYKGLCNSMIVESPGSSNLIVINGTNPVINYITDIQCNLSNIVIGAGEAVQISIKLKYEMDLNSSVKLPLNIENNGLYDSFANLESFPQRSNVLVFVYVVAQNDYALTFNVNESSFLQINSLNYDIALPSTFLGEFNVSVNTSIPSVNSVSVNTSFGEYGSGQVIRYQFIFNSEVIVIGKPLIFLSSKTFQDNNATAIYHSSSLDFKILYFDYLVSEGDSTVNLQIISNIIVDSTSKILRRSTNPITLASLSLQPTYLDVKQSIAINTEAPELNLTYGVLTSTPNGTYFPGQVMEISVKFTKPIVVVGSGYITLSVNVGFTYSAVFTRINADNQTMIFKLEVPLGSSTSELDIAIGDNSIKVPDDGSSKICRKSSLPYQAANINTFKLFYSGKSLRDTSSIKLSSYGPTVNEIYLINSTTQYYPDNMLAIAVKFSASVLCTCNPILTLNVGYSAEMNYFSGNMTNILIFIYKIKVGDTSANGIFLKSHPGPICRTSGCPLHSLCQIFALSTFPTLPAQLRIPNVYRASHMFGILINSSASISPYPLLRTTTILNISTDLMSGSYGPGTIITYNAIFTDAVYFDVSDQLYLYLNIGKYAKFTTGTGSNVLTFSITTDLNDSTTLLVPIIFSNNSSITCLPMSRSCNIKNKVGELVDITTVNTSLNSGNITLNPSKPFIESVYISQVMTKRYLNSYLSIALKFDKEVVVLGSTPFLLIYLSKNLKKAMYNDTLSNSTTLIFVYSDLRSIFNDTEIRLAEKSINVNDGKTQIFRKSDILMLRANVSFGHLDEINFPYIAKTYFNEFSFPKVLGVTAVNSSKTIYRAGDEIIIALTLSDEITFTGYAYINLDCGMNIGKALLMNSFLDEKSENFTSFSDSMKSKIFYFRYVVEENHRSYSLNYIDEYSLFPGLNTYGNDGRFEFNGEPVRLMLPFLKSNRSLLSSNIFVDARAPTVIAMLFTNKSGIYGAGESLCINIKFSYEILVKGKPYILLNTTPPRSAIYSGLNDEPIRNALFCYTIQPGDISSRLDYFHNFSNFNSVESSFVEADGRIVTYSDNPCQQVKIFLNPRGKLSGSLTISIDEGKALYSDLKISKYGYNFQLKYSAQVGDFMEYAYDNFNVSFSSEFQLKPSIQFPGSKNVGSSVGIHNNIAVVASPAGNYTATSVQLITLHSLLIHSQNEILLISTSVSPAPIILYFFTTAAVGATIGGSFTLAYGIHGKSRPIPFNADENILSAAINYDLPSLGKLSISRSDYFFCSCDNAFEWRITFHDLLLGKYENIIIDGSGLSGVDASIVGPVILQNSSYIEGEFSLSIADVELTRTIPSNASSDVVATAFESLGINVINVDRSDESISGSLSWKITFGTYNNSYSIPQININISLLTGGNIAVTQQILQKGSNGASELSGSFRLLFRNESTGDLAYDISAADMKSALENLENINEVDVIRLVPFQNLGYSWQVTLLSVNSFHVFDNYGVIESLKAINNLSGTNTSISVTNERFTYDNRNTEIYVFQLIDQIWYQVATLKSNLSIGSDGKTSSVSIYDRTIVVGEPYASDRPQPTIQHFQCNISGSFKFSLSGYLSPTIMSSMNYTEVSNLVLSAFPTVRGLRIEYFENTICSGADIEFSFYSLYNAIQILEIINVKMSVFGYIRFTLESENTACKALHPTGVVVIHILDNDCSEVACTSNVESLLKPISTSNELFGFSVALFKNTLAVGCPGCDYGQVFVYLRDSNQWSLQQALQNFESETYSLFGFSVAVVSNVIAVGSPYYNGKGKVDLFIADRFAKHYSKRSQILPDTFNVSEGARFGYSIALSGNFLVVSAPYNNSHNIYIGEDPVPAIISGFVAVFSSINYQYELYQVLKPSNVKPFDRFGYSVSIYENVIIATSLNEYLGLDQPANVVIKIETIFNNSAAGSFILSWKKYPGPDTTNPVPMYVTRPINFNVTAQEMWAILSEDFKVGFELNGDYEKSTCHNYFSEDGPIRVTRSVLSSYTHGFVWEVTFLDRKGIIPVFEVYSNSLSGGYVKTSFENPNPQSARGISHAFSNRDGKMFVEELFFSPYLNQKLDLCGSSSAISATFAIIGCPNRDYNVKTGSSGSAFVFNLDILDVGFSRKSGFVVEGESYQVSLSKNSSLYVNFYIRTVDLNSDDLFQNMISNIYNMDSYNVDYPSTKIKDINLFGNALAKSSADTDSRWIYGNYDYRGIADYYPINIPLAFQANQYSVMIPIRTTADSTSEADEKFTVAIYSRGIWPSFQGHLFHVVTLIDSNIGVSNDKLFYSNLNLPPSSYGKTIRIVDNILLIGVREYDSKLNSNKGKAIQYRYFNGSWDTVQVLESNMSKSTTFGDDIALYIFKHRNFAICAISEPFYSKVYVYMSTDGIFSFETSLQVKEANLPEHGFGDHGTLALENSLLVVGAPGLEAIFVFYRLHNDETGIFYWTKGKKIVSSDYKYDLVFSMVHLHPQRFGFSVSVSGRTALVGAPHADYSTLGISLPGANWRTDGESISTYGRGKAYVFRSIPPSQLLSINCSTLTTSGSFQLELNYSGFYYKTRAINISVSDAVFQAILKEDYFLDSVVVSSDVNEILNTRVTLKWFISFISEWTNLPLMKPLWFGNGCNECVQLHESCSLFVVSSYSVSGDFIETQTLSAEDKRIGDRFGSAVAIDQDSLVIGAPRSSAISRTTWDFETGNLIGWNPTGSAFNYQPTYGDNSYFRTSTYLTKTLSNGESSNIRGKYYIGTYEKHPGNSSDVGVPSSEFSVGTIQGDEPRGILTSDTFIVLGEKISFLIGGGCDPDTIFVELVVDGLAMNRVTGRCEERMLPAEFNVELFKDRSAYIRIVDNSSTVWGHINVDDFKFSWDTNRQSLSRDQQFFYLGNVESPFAGASYIYSNFFENSNSEYCKFRTSCNWKYQTRIQASNKRKENLFGSSVMIDHDNGIVAIVSPGASHRGNFREILSTFPYIKERIFPLNITYEKYLYAQPSNSPISNAAHAIIYNDRLRYFQPDARVLENVGSLYIFTRQNAMLTVNGTIDIPEHWNNVETLFIQPTANFEFAKLGDSISLSKGFAAFSTFKIQEVSEINVLSTNYFYIQFRKPLFSAEEGNKRFALIEIVRDFRFAKDELIVHYATSDITAKGISTDFAIECSKLPPSARYCGDYVHNSGLLNFKKGQSSSSFKILLLNTYCIHNYSRIGQVSLSIPGLGPIQSMATTALFRIEDNSASKTRC